MITSLFSSSEVYARAALMRNSHISLGTLGEKDTDPALFAGEKSNIQSFITGGDCNNAAWKQESMLGNLGADREASGVSLKE